MNSIFRKTLIATILSAILATVAIAEDNHPKMMDGNTADNKQLNTQQEKSLKDKSVVGKAQKVNETKVAKAPCDNGMKSGDSNAQANRPLSEHQGNVIDGEENATDESDDHRQESYSPENRPISDHQGNVTE